MIEWLQANFIALLNVTMIDLVLAGDNAIVVGLAASQVAPEFRARVIIWGIAGAVVLRIVFALLTNQLLAIVGLTLAGGLLLLWVCWKMYRQITTEDPGRELSEMEAAVASPKSAGTTIGFWTAVNQVVIADVSMSLDNVLAVAGAAKGSPLVLVIGLAIAIVLMAFASHYIAKLLVRYPWITWIGLIIIVWVALDMIYTGSQEVTCALYKIGCEESLWHWLTKTLR